MSGTDRPKGIVLLSGGLDSTTVLALARSNGYDVYAMSFRYGQRHAHELEAAARIAEKWKVAQHVVVDIDLRVFGGSALTADIDVPKDRPASELGNGIPITYVPARNTIFLSYALAWADVLGAHDIFIGVNALDYSGYPDCRPAYIAAYERMATRGTRVGSEGGEGIHIYAPLISLSKKEIIEAGLRMGVDYAETTSCYDPAPDGAACGHCDACTLRLTAFAQVGKPDPARYVDRPTIDLSKARA